MVKLSTTKGNQVFSSLRTACEWLEEFQPSMVSMDVDGDEVDYDFDTLPEFDAKRLERELTAIIDARVADELVAQEGAGRWSVLDSSGQRFWPATPATSAPEAIAAALAGAGTWHQ